MARRALAPLIALALLVTAGCGSDGTTDAASSGEVASTGSDSGAAGDTDESSDAAESGDSGADSDSTAESEVDGTSTETDDSPAAEPSDPTESDADPSSDDAAQAPGPDDIDDERFPIVIGAQASPQGADSWRFDVTLSSEYDTPERYADAWRVLDADDTELGIRVLTHDHANEQPFTRSTTVDVPAEITTVFIEGRDQDNGWSGQRYELELAATSD